MAKKEKVVSWTPIIVTAMILGFLLILIFSNTNLNSHVYESSRYIEKSDNSFETITYDSETITISGMSGTRTINLPEKDVKLIISGMSNIITISKETSVSKIILSGQDNQINLCQSIHSPELVESGLNNNIRYLNC